MGKFIFSPILSLYDRRFYGRMSRENLGKGVLYLLYLSLLVSLVTVVSFSVAAMPQINQSAQWVRENMPPLDFTREGVKSPVKQPFELVHPEWGSLLLLDTNRETITDEETRRAFFFVTKTKVYIWDKSKNEHRIVDARPLPGETSGNWQDFHVDGDVLWRFYEAARPFAAPVVFIVAFFVFFAWKMSAAFFYSVFALLINIFRKRKLPYEKLLNLCFFALTPVIFLQGIKTAFPGFMVPVNFWLSLAVTCGYLTLAILGTPETDTAEQPVSGSPAS